MSGFKGGKRFRRILQQLPDEARRDLVEAFGRAGRRAQAAMRARAKHKTGTLQQGIKYRVSPTTLRLQVGLLGTKRGRSKLFYGFVLDKGRKAQTVRITRGPRAGASMKIRALPGDHFVSGEYPDLRDGINREVRPLFNRILTRLSQGVAND
ncbi:hypothetical protein GCM10022253_19470 [Sphingomonas endophytica]|uniref:Tail protein n=1 Tax=Sphingomonas endophytica TaxID=869719 RepID=A0ABR6N9U0_9SPHN|nr:HK97 gp10 family phage protein [Sphingomonas endophytica]MBB5727314.1 hypothetical protein [Sphingomonas endophytica]